MLPLAAVPRAPAIRSFASVNPCIVARLWQLGWKPQLLSFPGFQLFIGVGLWSLLVEGLVSEAICLGVWTLGAFQAGMVRVK